MAESLMDKVVTVLGALGAGGVLTYLGSRYSAKKSAEPGLAMANVETEKLTLEKIRLILQQHEDQIKDLQEELGESKQALRTSRTLLKWALQHIGLLRRDMRAAGVEPPALPEKLTSECLPWDLNMYE